MLSNELAPDLLQLSMLDGLINFSDHLAIELSCVIPLVVANVPADVTPRPSHCNFRWDRANLCEYYNACFTRLQRLMNKLNELYTERVISACLQ